MTTPGKTETQAENYDSVRRWAQQHGFDVKPRGRLSIKILDAYDHRDEKPQSMSMTDFTIIRAAVRRREEQIAQAMIEQARRAEPGGRAVLRKFAKELLDGRV